MQCSFRPRAASISAVAIASVVSSLMLLPALPAAAGIGPATTSGVVVGALSPVQATKLPNSNIEWNGKMHLFSPKTLKTTWSGGTETKCTEAKQRITISNPLKNTQTVTYEGAFLVNLPPGYQFGACFWGSGVGSFTFGVDKSKSDLTVSVQ
jgi:hypothetical protein